MISKIIFAVDSFRWRHDIGTVVWFYNTFAYYIKNVCDLPIYMLKNAKFVSSKNDLAIDIDKIYKCYNVPFDKLTVEEKNIQWAFLYNNDEFNKEAYEYAYEIFKDSIVIAHEIPTFLKNILEYYNIPYIDTNTHPIRFMDDIFFCFSSNHRMIYEKLLNYRLDDNNFFHYANYVRSFYQYRLGFDARLENNSVLFCGQTEIDKSIIDNKELYRIINHKKEFEQAVKGYSHIYFKKHPYSKLSDDDELYKYLKSFKNLSFISDNFYQLMSSDKIEKVVAISSGTLIEANYFGKVTENLLHPSLELQLDCKFDPTKYISIYHSYLTNSFWANILSPCLDVKKNISDVRFFSTHNLLRNQRNLYWGFEDPEQNTLLQKFKINLPSPANLVQKTDTPQTVVPQKVPVSNITQKVSSTTKIKEPFFSWKKVNGYYKIKIWKIKISKKIKKTSPFFKLEKTEGHYRIKIGKLKISKKLRKKAPQTIVEKLENKNFCFDLKQNRYHINRPMLLAQGINSIGFFKENIGLSHAARYFTRILQHEKIPFTVNHFELKKDGYTNHEFDRYFDDSLKYNVNVFNFNSNYCMEYYKRFPERFNNRYNIGYGYWEFEKYPLSFLNQNNIFDEIWAPTDFILKSLCQYYTIPVVKMPIAIDFDLNKLSQYNRKYFGLPENAFAFIFTFDVGSEIGGRKNSLGVIEAFRKAFAADDESVCLVIKTAPRTSEEKNPKHKEILDKLYKIAEQKNIVIYNKILTDDEMRGLINSCQVYVSLHRSEGLGLGMIEAMKMGKPVIATGYSGNTEFMKYDNSCLVDYNLVPSNLFDTLVQGHVWADPDIMQASYYMKKLYSDPSYYRNISIKAKQYIDVNHNYGIVGNMIKNRLKLLGLLN